MMYNFNLLPIHFDALNRNECESETRTRTKIHVVAIVDTTRYIQFISTRNSEFVLFVGILCI